MNYSKNRKMKINPEKIKKMIGKIELIKNEDLGIVMSQSLYGNYILSFYSEAFECFNVEQMTDLKEVFWGIEGCVTFIERKGESSEGLGSKRELLDLMNAVYLLHNANKKIIDMVKDVNFLHSKVFNAIVR